MEADLDKEEVLQPQPKELSESFLLTAEYLGVNVTLQYFYMTRETGPELHRQEQWRLQVYGCTHYAYHECSDLRFASQSFQQFVQRFSILNIPPSFQFEANVYIPFKVHCIVRDVNLNCIYLQSI